MTDLEKFISLYQRFGINLQIESAREFQVVSLMQQHPSNNFEGDADLYSSVYFNKDGKFMRQGFYE